MNSLHLVSGADVNPAGVASVVLSKANHVLSERDGLVWQ